MSRATRRNLALALVVGLAVGASPHTSAHRILPSAVGGALAAAAAFVWRQRSGRGERPPVLRLGRRSWLLAALLLVSGLAFAPTLTHLLRIYTHSIWWNGHGLFVPLVMASLAAAILRREGPGEESASPWGLALLALALGLAVVDAGPQSVVLGVLGLVLFPVALSLLVLGPRRTRALALPLALGSFLLPLPTSVASFVALPEATAVGVGAVFETLGVPVSRSHAVLWLPSQTFGVSDNCSGFSALYAGLGFALLLAGCGRSPARAVLLLLALWPLTWLANVARTSVVLAVCERFGIGFLDTALHGLSGIAAFWLVMLGLWLLSDRGAVRRAFA
jgi:exosortase